MLVLPRKFLQYCGIKQLRAYRHGVPRWHVRAGAFFVRPLPRGLLSAHSGGAVRLGVYPLPCGVVEHLICCHICGGLPGVPPGDIQRSGKRKQFSHVRAMSRGHGILDQRRTQPRFLPKLRSGAAVLSRDPLPYAFHVRWHAIALFFPHAAHQLDCDPARRLHVYREHFTFVDGSGPFYLGRRHVFNLQRRRH